MLFGLLELAILLEPFLELTDFWADIRFAVRFIGMLCEVILMVGFSLIEDLQGGNLGDDLTSKSLFLLKLFEYRFDGRLLLLGFVKNHRTVSRSKIRTLMIQACRIMGFEEDPQEFFVGYDGRIVFDLDHLGVPGMIRKDLFVARIRNVPPGIA